MKLFRLTQKFSESSYMFFGFTFGVFALFTAVLVTLFTPGVMVNDDIAMMAFSNGDFTGKPESQLVFIGTMIGWILQRLHNFNSSVPWYPLLMVSIQIFASAIITTAFFKFSNRRVTRELLATIAIIILVMPVLVLDISFSTTAMYAAMVGIVTTGFILESREKFGHQFNLIVLSLLVIAASLRFDFLLAASLLLLPYFIVRYKKSTLRISLVAMMFAIVPICTHYFENFLGTSKKWTEYREFNSVRGSMHGTPALSRFVSTAYEDSTIRQIREFGWESEDLLLFGNWYFENSDLYNTETLKQLRDKLDITPTNLPLQPSIEAIIYGRELFVILGLLVSFLVIAGGVQRTRQIFGTQAIWFLIGSIYISSRYRFPDRFAMGAFAGLFVSLIACSLILKQRRLVVTPSIPKRTTVMYALIMPVCLFGSALNLPHKFSAVEISHRNQVEENRLQAELDAIDSVTSIGGVVFVGAQIASEGINPWTDRTLLAGNRFLGLGWATGSPHQELRKSQMELDGIFLTRLAEGINNHLITSTTVADLIKYSYERRYGKLLNLEPVRNLPYGTIFAVSINPGNEVDLFEKSPSE